MLSYYLESTSSSPSTERMLSLEDVVFSSSRPSPESTDRLFHALEPPIATTTGGCT